MILYPRTIFYWQYRGFNITDSANIYWMHTIHKSLCCAGLSRSVVSDSLWPVDCSSPGSPVHVASPGKNTGVGCHAILQGIFPTQGLNPGLPHCRWILYHLSHEGSPRLEWVAYAFSRDLPDPGIEPGSPELQVTSFFFWQMTSLPAELPGKPHYARNSFFKKALHKNFVVDSLSYLCSMDK